MTPQEIKTEIKRLYAYLGKRYRTVSERRPIEKEIKELKALLPPTQSQLSGSGDQISQSIKEKL